MESTLEIIIYLQKAIETLRFFNYKNFVCITEENYNDTVKIGNDRLPWHHPVDGNWVVATRYVNIIYR